MENTVDLLYRLTSATGVSGAEENIVSVLSEILEPYGEVTVDSLNTVCCTFGEGYHFLLDAHIDEIGLIVTEITDDGFIRVDKCGGIDRRILLGYEVSVWGKKELFGVISTLPPHLIKDEDKNKTPEFKDIAIDTGLSKTELDELVKPGDRVTLRRNFTMLLNNRISASCLDDRAGVAALLLTLDELKKLNCKVTVMLSSQEEVGGQGAKAAAYSKQADEAIAVDVSFAYAPDCDRRDTKELGKGSMIGFSPILNKDMSNALVDTAKAENIPFQYEIMSSRTGTNADAITVTESGIKTALISIPQRYMHQPVEVVDISDIENVSQLIVAYIKRRVGELSA